MLTAFPNLPEHIRTYLQVYSEQFDSEWPDVLSQAELGRRSEMTHPGRKLGFTLGRTALRRLLSEELSVAPRDVPIQIEPSGQLTCPSSNRHISLAHSGNQAIAVSGSSHLGIDLEEVRPKPEALLHYILGDSERTHIAELRIPDTHRLFLAWTLKEAVLKAEGIGLRSSPRSVVLQVDVDTQHAMMVDATGRTWQGRYCISGSWISAIAF